jgi:hypothetical protein
VRDVVWGGKDILEWRTLGWEEGRVELYNAMLELAGNWSHAVTVALRDGGCALGHPISDWHVWLCGYERVLDVYTEMSYFHSVPF